MLTTSRKWHNLIHSSQLLWCSPCLSLPYTNYISAFRWHVLFCHFRHCCLVFFERWRRLLGVDMWIINQGIFVVPLISDCQSLYFLLNVFSRIDLQNNQIPIHLFFSHYSPETSRSLAFAQEPKKRQCRQVQRGQRVSPSARTYICPLYNRNF